MTRNQELREEAKKRGYTHDNFKCLKDLKHTSNPDLNKWYYEGCTDTLFSNSCGNGGKVVYKEGVWAEMIKPIETFTPVAMRCIQETLTLENTQIDCSELKQEEINLIGTIYENKGYKLSTHYNKVTDECYYISLNKVLNCFGFYGFDQNQYLITYEKFMELFGDKEKELSNSKNMVDLMGYSVLVDNEEQARKLQETAFEQGFRWINGVVGVKHLGEESFQFGYGGKKVKTITFNPNGRHYQNKYVTKKAHFNDLFKKETLQEKAIRLENELKEVKQQIEEENKIKAGDWVVVKDTSTFFKVKGSSIKYLDSRHEKITNPDLIKLLEQEVN